MTDLDKFTNIMNEIGISYNILTSRIIEIKGLLWVFDDDGKFMYLEDPDGIKRQLPSLRNDIKLH
jgi:hypothetical protein